MGRSGYRLIALVVILGLIPVWSHAVIEEKSSIVGSFLGESNKPQSGVTVRLLDSFFLNEVARTVTDRKGQFILAGVLPGLYLLSVESASMQGMMKRIQVTSDSPTFIDIRPLLTEEQLKEHNAWDRFKWTIRMAERNPLRDEGETTVSPVQQPDSDGFLATLRNFEEANNIEGQISYLNVGSGPMSSSLNHQVAHFLVQGELEDSGTWSVNGNLQEGPRTGYIAAGDIHYHMADHQINAAVSANDLLVARYPDLATRQRITRFLQTPDSGDDPVETNPWIASIDLQDSWQLRSFEVGYGTRFDYYGYLQDAVGYSPRVRLTYHVDPNFSVHGAFYRNTSAPGNYYLQADDVHPYIHDLAFVPYGSTLRPESTTGYETGFDFAANDFTFSVVYNIEDVHDKVAAVDLSDSPANATLQSIRPFVIFNAKDLTTHGIEINATKQLSHKLSAMVTYNMCQAVPVYIVEKRVFSQRQLYFINGAAPMGFHDFQAGIRADIQQTLTEVNASWKWSSGSPLVFGRQESNSSLSALDIEVYQGLPVRVFDDGQLKLLVAIKNLLDQNPEFNSNADFQRALLYGMPRVIAGGVLVRF
ncbi:MAG TPA: TonB-dependent receptor [Acidobacteriota bacterium]|nr:TonB-dependent receptor [Acidobacteriota bacterium]